jgi:hypothetical protein
MKKWSFVALLLVGATFLGATVLREPIASAAQSVSATIVGPLDGNGNVKVHEQGTASVTSLDDPGRRAFAFFKNDSFGSSEDSHLVSFTVPAGKRLVIPSISINAGLDSGTGQKLVSTAVQAQVNGQLEDYIMAPTFTGTSTSGRDLYTVSQQTTVYADGGTDVKLFGVRNTFSGGAILNVSVQGYLIDCSAASCN